jgi:hypothetical protein
MWRATRPSSTILMLRSAQCKERNIHQYIHDLMGFILDVNACKQRQHVQGCSDANNILLWCALLTISCNHYKGGYPLQGIIVEYCGENKPTGKCTSLSPLFLILLWQRCLSSVNWPQIFSQRLEEELLSNYSGTYNSKLKFQLTSNLGKNMIS